MSSARTPAPPPEPELRSPPAAVASEAAILPAPPAREPIGREGTPGFVPEGLTGPAEEQRVAPPQRAVDSFVLQRSQGGEELAGEVLHQVRVGLDPRRRTALIRLDPPELGQVSIRLEVDAGRVRAIVRAESAETLVLLERHLPELRAALAAQGLEADELDLGRWRGRENGSGRGGEQEPLTPSRRRGTPAGPSTPEPGAPQRVLTLGPGLDTYA